ncbi:MAG: hypothetical protein ACOCNJ_04705 [Bacteroidales bacterium]
MGETKALRLLGSALMPAVNPTGLRPQQAVLFGFYPPKQAEQERFIQAFPAFPIR